MSEESYQKVVTSNVVGESIIRHLFPIQSYGGVTKDPTQVVKEGAEICSLRNDLRCVWFDGNNSLLSFICVDLLNGLRGGRCFSFTLGSWLHSHIAIKT